MEEVDGRGFSGLGGHTWFEEHCRSTTNTGVGLGGTTSCLRRLTWDRRRENSSSGAGVWCRSWLLRMHGWFGHWRQELVSEQLVDKSLQRHLETLEVLLLLVSRRKISLEDWLEFAEVWPPQEVELAQWPFVPSVFSSSFSFLQPLYAHFLPPSHFLDSCISLNLADSLFFCGTCPSILYLFKAKCLSFLFTFILICLSFFFSPFCKINVSSLQIKIIVINYNTNNTISVFLFSQFHI